jgi:multiple antibiotic resistance protein
MQGLASAHEYLRFFVTLTAVVDPFLAVPFFIAFTASYSEAERAALARVVVLTVLGVLAVSTFIGDVLLAMMGASLPAFRVGGGLVLLLMALAMLNAEAGRVRQSDDEARELQHREMSGVVPLAIPLLAGPGAISTSILAAEKGGVAHQLVLVFCIAPRLRAGVGGVAPGARNRRAARHHRPEHRDADPRPAARGDGGGRRWPKGSRRCSRALRSLGGRR